MFIIFSIPLGKNSDLHLIKLILFYWHNGKTYDEQQSKNKEKIEAYMTAVGKIEKKNKDIENNNAKKCAKQQNACCNNIIAHYKYYEHFLQ